MIRKHCCGAVESVAASRARFGIETDCQKQGAACLAGRRREPSPLAFPLRPSRFSPRVRATVKVKHRCLSFAGRGGGDEPTRVFSCQKQIKQRLPLQHGLVLA
jgi:hypothetical protein